MTIIHLPYEGRDDKTCRLILPCIRQEKKKKEGNRSDARQLDSLLHFYWGLVTAVAAKKCYFSKALHLTTNRRSASYILT